VNELKVRDLMSRDVITLSLGEDLSLAEELMRLGRVRHLPVVDESGGLVGLVTHRDLLKAQVSTMASLSAAEDKRIKRSIRPGAIMSRDVMTVSSGDPALKAARLMRDEKIGCLPVVDRSQLVGIITEADFLDLVIRVLQGTEGEEKHAKVG
jgi:CBS domain-containing membrane protein